MRHARAWLVLGPAVLVGVLVGHDLAYRATGTTEGPEHDYLAHCAQALLVLAVVGVVLTGSGPRTLLPSRSIAPVAALGTFVLQEHVERLVHTGSLPWLLTTPAFLVGLVLQLPIALLAWVLAREVLDGLAELSRIRVTRSSPFVVTLDPLRGADLSPTIGAPLPGRGPPAAPLP